MNQHKLVGASLVAATGLGLLLVGFAAARLGLWAGGWSGADLDAAADALARWLTVALVAALFAWLRRAALELRRELAGRLDTLADEVNRASRPARSRAGLPARKAGQARVAARLDGVILSVERSVLRYDPELSFFR